MSGLWTRFPIATRQTLLDIYMFKGSNKNIRTRHEICVKLKHRNKYTKAALSNGVLLYFWVYFLLSSGIFIVEFEHLNDGWEVNSMILTITIKVIIITSKTRQGQVCFYSSSLPEYSKIFGNLQEKAFPEI